MEPFRPLVDKTVRSIIDSDLMGKTDLTPDLKQKLTRVLDLDVDLQKGNSTVMNALYRLAQTFVTSLQKKENVLEFPKLKPATKLV